MLWMLVPSIMAVLSSSSHGHLMALVSSTREQCLQDWPLLQLWLGRWRCRFLQQGSFA